MEKKINSTLVQQIEARMRVQGISTMYLEKKAGLKPHAVRNILTGKSKKPSAFHVQAIAEALRCKVEDLLTTPPFMQTEQNDFSREEILTKKYARCLDNRLIEETVEIVDTLLQGKGATVKQFLVCLKEVYLHSQKDPTTVNKKYARWFINLID